VSAAFQQAICNEVYEHWPLENVCASLRRIGYAGIETTSFTLAKHPGQIPASERKRLSKIIQDHGLRFIGRRWLMASSKGLHVTTLDRALRERSWRHIAELIDPCADLGDGGVKMFGPPKQRCTVDGLTREEATRNFVAGLAGVVPHAAGRGVTILEALPGGQCDATLAEAVDIVRQIENSAARTMFDTHNAVDGVEPHAVLVDRYFDLIHHVHINEMDGRHPGTGGYDFKPVLDVLWRRGYRHWVSLEVFYFAPGTETMAGDALRFIEKKIEQLPV
jgi:sugar phosphate isomerase/epimerase